MQMISLAQSMWIFFRSIGLAIKDMAGISLLIAIISGIAFVITGTQYTAVKELYSGTHLFLTTLFTALAICYAKVRFEGKNSNVGLALSQFFHQLVSIIGTAGVVAVISFLITKVLLWLLNISDSSISSIKITMPAGSFSLSPKAIAAIIAFGVINLFVFFIYNYLLATVIIGQGSISARIRQWITTVPKTIIAFFGWTVSYVLLIVMLIPIIAGIIFGFPWLLSLSEPLPDIAIAEFRYSIGVLITSATSIFFAELLTVVGSYFAAALAWYATYDRLPNDYER